MLTLETRGFSDARGDFFETWSLLRYAQAGLPTTFVQDNVSRSHRGVLRGLHYQLPNAQGKLLSVLEGEIFDVAVDIRRGSPTFRQWVGATLSAENRRQLYVPPGCAHGFQAVSATAVVLYKCTEYYHPSSEQSVLWSDEELAIPWALPPILADKDRDAPRLRDIPESRLPEFAAT
ncbi:dTDP-4-dehydrorhamnose 3,5-epimerase [soil metagenome]